MVSDYHNQTATLRAPDGTYTSEGQPNYTESSIQVRYERHRALVRNQAGTEVVSEARVFTTASIDPDAEITFNGETRRVITVKDDVGLDGTVLQREVRL